MKKKISESQKMFASKSAEKETLFWVKKLVLLKNKLILLSYVEMCIKLCISILLPNKYFKTSGV